MRIALIILTAVCAWAQSGLNRPQLGMMLDSSGAARPVFGLPGSASVADPAMTGVVSLGCGSFCLMKTDSSLIAPGQSVSAPAGPALFAFDSSGAFVYFPRARQLARWQSGQLTMLRSGISGNVVSMRSVEGAPEFAVRVVDQIRIVNDGGAVAYQFPQAAQSAMLLADGAVYSTGQAVVLWRSDGSEMSFPLVGAESFVAMAPDYVEILTAGAIYGLRVTPGREQLFELPRTTQAQLSLFTFDGATETPVAATYSYGNIATGTSSIVRFRVFNNGNSPVTIYGPTTSGVGFAVTALNGTLPYQIPAATTNLNFFEFTVTFTAGSLSPANYSASLQIQPSPPSSLPTMNVLLVATIPGTTSGPPGTTPVPEQPLQLEGFPTGCSPDGNGGVAFAAVTIRSHELCNLNLMNPNSFAITVTAITVSGDPAFSLQPQPTVPQVLAANSSTALFLQFTPVCGHATPTYSGTLVIASTSSFSPNSLALSGNGLTPAGLPQPMFLFDGQPSTAFSSGQQHALSISVPSPSACGDSGTLSLAFTPESGLPNDSSIVFASGPNMNFTVAAGSSQVLINGSASATFSSGSTAGTITFTLTTVEGATFSTPVSIPAAPIYIDSALASDQVLGQLNISVTGYDNTYSAGQMTFTFFDASGQQVGQPIAANFTSNFNALYSGQTMGSTFLMQVSFPATGNCVLSTLTPDCPANQVIATVQATLTNSAGQTQTGTLTFQ